MQPQLTLPIPFETNPTILGCPITSLYFDHHSQQRIEVIGGRYAGSEYIYEITYSDSLLNQDWLPLIDAWEHQTEPQANPEHWECKYCPYHDECDKSPYNVS